MGAVFDIHNGVPLNRPCVVFELHQRHVSVVGRNSRPGRGRKAKVANCFRKRHRRSQAEQDVRFGMERQRICWMSLHPSSDTRGERVTDRSGLATVAVVVEKRPRKGRDDDQESAPAMILNQSASNVIWHLHGAAEVVSAGMKYKREVELPRVHYVGPGQLPDVCSAVSQPETRLEIAARKHTDSPSRKQTVHAVRRSRCESRRRNGSGNDDRWRAKKLCRVLARYL